MFQESKLWQVHTKRSAGGTDAASPEVSSTAAGTNHSLFFYTVKNVLFFVVVIFTNVDTFQLIMGNLD